MGLCCDLIDNYGFDYLLTGKVNQDNLEKFFGTVRQTAGCNDHPDCATFLKIYKILSTYSIIKAPKYGNCTVTEDEPPPLLVSIEELREIYGKKESKYKTAREELQKRLDEVIVAGDWEADDIIITDNYDDASLDDCVVNCIIYYVTGYLCKKVLQSSGKSCSICYNALVQTKGYSNCLNTPSELVDIKSKGGLIHYHFFDLIKNVELSFQKYAASVNAFDETLEDVLINYDFSFPCIEHGSSILSFAICYYLKLRMRQFCQQENRKLKKQFVVKKKFSKLTTVS